jgi:hypothetical protein
LLICPLTCLPACPSAFFAGGPTAFAVLADAVDMAFTAVDAAAVFLFSTGALMAFTLVFDTLGEEAD